MNRITVRAEEKAAVGDLKPGTIVKLEKSHFDKEIQDYSFPELRYNDDYYMILCKKDSKHTSVANLYSGGLYYVQNDETADEVFDSEVTLKKMPLI